MLPFNLNIPNDNRMCVCEIKKNNRTMHAPVRKKNRINIDNVSKLIQIFDDLTETKRSDIRCLNFDQ